MITWEAVINAERDAREWERAQEEAPAPEEPPTEAELVEWAEPEETAAEAYARISPAERAADDRYVQQRRQAERQLQRRQDDLLLDPETVTGKNAELRAAQLRRSSDAHLHALDAADAILAERRVTVNLLRHQHSSLKAIARVLGGAA